MCVMCVTAEARGSSGFKPVWAKAEAPPVCMKRQHCVFVLEEEKCRVTRVPLSLFIRQLHHNGDVQYSGNNLGLVDADCGWFYAGHSDA